MTQYGVLVTWKINDKGCMLGANEINSKTFADIRQNEKDYLSIKIGIQDNAKYKGGINLFGKKFGDHNQDIAVKFSWERTQTKGWRFWEREERRNLIKEKYRGKKETEFSLFFISIPLNFSCRSGTSLYFRISSVLFPASIPIRFHGILPGFPMRRSCPRYSLPDSYCSPCRIP